jgi:hypothetical protein
VNIFLLAASGLALLYAIFKPLGDGLFDTSAWVAKMLTPPDADEESAKRLMKFGQAALMEGWLSNIPFIASILFFASIAVSFFYHWWAPIIMYFVAGTLGVLTKLFWGRSVSFYLSFIHHKMVNRRVDYKRDNDVERFEAADSYCKDLQQVMLLYDGSGLRPPTPKQLKDVPNGDLSYWLEAHGQQGDFKEP